MKSDIIETSRKVKEKAHTVHKSEERAQVTLMPECLEDYVCP